MAISKQQTQVAAVLLWLVAGGLAGAEWALYLHLTRPQMLFSEFLGLAAVALIIINLPKKEAGKIVAKPLAVAATKVIETPVKPPEQDIPKAALVVKTTLDKPLEMHAFIPSDNEEIITLAPDGAREWLNNLLVDQQKKG